MKPKSTLALLLLLISFSMNHASAGEFIALRAGPLTMVFDVENAMLRFVRYGRNEVLHGINAPVRNQFWGTLATEVSGVQLNDGGDHFTLQFDVTCQERDIDFTWKGTITGTEEGRVVFTFDGEARSTFLRNRLGFCVLHGPSAAGQPWLIEDVQGNKKAGHFPNFISPHQPAKNIRVISHKVTEDVWADVRCEGDVFEMEDQRNWTDASFKTYCTPLELPFPVQVTKGTKIKQQVQFGIRRKAVPGAPNRLLPLPPATPAQNNIAITIADQSSGMRRIPGIGLQTSSQVSKLSDLQLTRLRKLNLDHLRVALNLATDPLTDILTQVTHQANALGIGLHVALQFDEHPEKELEKLATAVQITQPPVTAWFVMAANAHTIRLTRAFLNDKKHKAMIGVGETHHFTDLNRNRPGDSDLPLVSYGLNPQCHAHDNLTMIETLAIQGDTVRSARQFIGKRKLIISPITLKYQVVSQPPLEGELPSNVDGLRQSSLFAAGWTLGSIKYLSEAGVEALTYYETVGWKGIMAPDRTIPLPPVFQSRPDEVFPIYHILREVADFTGGEVGTVQSSQPLSAVGLILSKENRLRLLLANLTDQPQSLVIEGLVPGTADVFSVNQSNSTMARRDPEAFRDRSGTLFPVSDQKLAVQLPPYGLARIDQER